MNQPIFIHKEYLSQPLFDQWPSRFWQVKVYMKMIRPGIKQFIPKPTNIVIIIVPATEASFADGLFLFNGTKLPAVCVETFALQNHVQQDEECTSIFGQNYRDLKIKLFCFLIKGNRCLVKPPEVKRKPQHITALICWRLSIRFRGRCGRWSFLLEIPGHVTQQSLPTGIRLDPFITLIPRNFEDPSMILLPGLINFHFCQCGRSRSWPVPVF